MEKEPLKILQKYIKDKPEILIVGSKQNFKLMKLGKIKELFYTSDCSNELKEKFHNYSKFSETPISNLGKDGEEISLLLGKSIPISIVGVLVK